MNYIKVEDLNLKELNIYHSVNEAGLLHYYEPDEGIFIAETAMVVLRALDAGYEPLSLLIEDKFIIENDENLKDQKDPDVIHDDADPVREVLSRVKDIPVYIASQMTLKGITGYEVTRGFLCAMRRKKLPAIEDTLKGARRITVLDGVVNPTNVGAIVRSAAALNIDAILFTKDCADPLYRRAIRVSMGNIFNIPWTIISNDRPKNMDKLKSLGFMTVSMALCENSIGIDDTRLLNADKLAIIMGTEGEGLSNEVIKASDHTAKIPMSNGVDSLNVAAASAVIFWELSKRDRP